MIKMWQPAGAGQAFAMQPAVQAFTLRKKLMVLSKFKNICVKNNLGQVNLIQKQQNKYFALLKYNLENKKKERRKKEKK